MTRFTNESTTNHDSFDDGDRATSREERLDQSLDALIHGDPDALNDLDPEMRAAVTQMYQWADLAGVSRKETVRPTHASVARAVPADSAPVTSIDHEIPRQKRRTSPGRILMSTLSAIAAALILGLGIYGAVPIFTDHDPDSTEIAFQSINDGTPEAVSGTPASMPPADVPESLIYQGGEPLVNADGTIYTPPVGTVLTGKNGEDALNPVSPSECTVAPRSRDEVVQILSTSPRDGADPSQSVTGDDAYGDSASLGDLQAIFREWQACRRFGKTWQATALETEQFIRSDFYVGGGLLGNWMLPDVAYSEETINGILDGRVSLDEAESRLGDQQAQGPLGSEAGLNLNLWVIDATPPVEDPSARPYESFDGGTRIGVTVVWTCAGLNNASPLPSAYVNFERVDGQWLIASWQYQGIASPVVD